MDHPQISSMHNLFFDNIDQSMDIDNLISPKYLQLEVLTASGIPVDDLPVFEVWTSSGLVYCSNSSNNLNNCSWDAESGEGKYSIKQVLFGDFSIHCRFGGSHSNTVDRATLIFRYQNNTG